MAHVGRDEAVAIWQAGVDAVRSDQLVHDAIQFTDHELVIRSQRWSLDDFDRLIVVGAGKAVRGMGSGLEEAIGEKRAHDKRLHGWLNVPADCAQPLQWIHIHAARPAALNEPTLEGVYGTQQILQLVSSLTPRDLCLCLLSGGGSALLPAPRPGVTLDELLRVTKVLSAAGANIEQLNSIRKRLSAIQGGQLALACRAGWLVTLLISDVLGDPLDIIASGPTVLDESPASSAAKAIATWDEFSQRVPGQLPSHLRHYIVTPFDQPRDSHPLSKLSYHLLANNQTAVDAAAREAARRGFQVIVLPGDEESTDAEFAGRRLASKIMSFQEQALHEPRQPICLISGGEPVVRLVEASRRGRGGRNQQLVLAALKAFFDAGSTSSRPPFVVLSGGTDGEDGPTDAAGAILDQATLRAADSLSLDASHFLAHNDAYSFFLACGSLLITGPTHTNVCDLRVALL